MGGPEVGGLNADFGGALTGGPEGGPLGGPAGGALAGGPEGGPLGGASRTEGDVFECAFTGSETLA